MKSKLFTASVLALGLSLAGSRVMATPTSTTWTDTSADDAITGWTLAAEVRDGSNGNEDRPDLDYDLLDESWSGDGGYIYWDSNIPAQNFTTGGCSARFTMDLSIGTASFIVVDSNSNTHEADYTGATGSVDYIAVNAAVEAAGTTAWSSVDMEFYKNGTLREGYGGGSPSYDGSTTTYGEQVLYVTPSDTDDNKVVVSGNFEMDDDTPYFGTNDNYCQILAFSH